ncbi:MAG: hypothetical protein Q8R61_13105 [Thiobacillus sp.]|uniref:hypothetical protein n=1 Tax=Thiobacillus sp. TaxID=924 RepID=UPI0027375740|nr:hypothetical protein [Thiobacillus sp.]MDP3586062.1 hypothetical protein [Thiobacillus sp.]
MSETLPLKVRTKDREPLRGACIEVSLGALRPNHLEVVWLSVLREQGNRNFGYSCEEDFHCELSLRCRNHSGIKTTSGGDCQARGIQ